MKISHVRFFHAEAPRDFFLMRAVCVVSNYEKGLAAHWKPKPFNSTFSCTWYYANRPWAHDFGFWL